MENEYRLLAEKLENSHSQLASRLMAENDCCSNISEFSFNNTLPFRYLAAALASDEPVPEAEAMFAGFGKEMALSKVPFHVLKDYLYCFKESITLFLEEETTSVKTAMLVVKLTDSAVKSTFTTFRRFQKDSQLANRLRSLYEEESITLKELKDLKNALKEATIFTITDKNDKIRYANEKFSEITKYSSEELAGKNHHSLLYSGCHNDEFYAEIRRAIKNGEIWNGEICNKAKDGSLFWVDTTIIPFMDSEGESYQHISIQHDITDKKKAEETLQKAEKISLIGEMAAGLAHEIRNPLTTIKGFMQILGNFSEDKKTLYSKTVLEEIERINFIVSELMVFSRPHAIPFKDCCLAEIIENASELLASEAQFKGISLTSRVRAPKTVIPGDKNQLTQVFLNLIKNSIESLPLGGNIDLFLTGDHEKTRIIVADNGIGMSPAQLERLGEPFFTTKETGNGLGLMVSYKIIESHQGSLLVESEPNKGTRFVITFPV